MWRDIEHFAIPAGPNGTTPLYLVSFAHGLMKYSKNQTAAREFLKWFHSKDQFGKWFEIENGYSAGATTYWETHPMWDKVDEALKAFRLAPRGSRMFGYAGPPSAKAAEAYSKYIITDMYAKAVQGMSAEDAVKVAEGGLQDLVLDQLLGAVHDEEEALVVHVADVAGVVPAVAVDGLRGLGGAVEIALHDLRAADPQLAFLAHRQLRVRAARRVDDLHLGVGHDAAGRAGLERRVVGRAQVGDRARLGHAVALDHRAAEPGAERAPHLLAERGSPREQ